MSNIDVPGRMGVFFEQIVMYKQQQSPWGRKFRLMGLVAETLHLTEVLRRDVLQRVEHEAVLDADVDTDYDELAERVLQQELTEGEDRDESEDPGESEDGDAEWESEGGYESEGPGESDGGYAERESEGGYAERESKSPGASDGGDAERASVSPGESKGPSASEGGDAELARGERGPEGRAALTTQHTGTPGNGAFAARMEPAVIEALERMALVDGMLTLGQLTRLENEALGELSGVLTRIAVALEHSREAEEYVRLYDQEMKRFKASKKGLTVQLNFDKWMNDVHQGCPSVDAIEEYIIGRLLHLFETEIFSRKLSPMQNRKCYQNEVKLDMLDDDHPLKKTVFKHYRVLRSIVDYSDGYLVVNAAKAGRYFYLNRKEPNAKNNRRNFFKYIFKIELAQEVHRRLMEEVRVREAEERAAAEARAAAAAEAARKAEEEAAAEARAAEEKAGLNRFAPMKLLQEMLRGEWFGQMRSDKRYDGRWSDAFVSALMATEWGDEIARVWAAGGVRNKRMQVRGHVVGLLKDAGVLKGSYDAISKAMGIVENPRLFSRYMGDGKKQRYAEWVRNYVTSQRERPRVGCEGDSEF